VSSSSPSVGDSITLAAIVAVAVSETGVPSGTVEFYPMFDAAAGDSCGRPMVFSGFLGVERAFFRDA
jgi:hypothetical protein